MKSYRYINKQVEQNSVNYTLIIEDSSSLITTRVEKCFKIDPKLIDDEFLRSQALIEMSQIVGPVEESLEEEENGNINE